MIDSNYLQTTPIILHHPISGEVKVLKENYVIGNIKISTKNPQLIIKLLLGLGFRMDYK